MSTVPLTWDGKTYQMDVREAQAAEAAQTEANKVIVQLPDGTILEILNWHETCPPKPRDMVEVNAIKAELETTSR